MSYRKRQRHTGAATRHSLCRHRCWRRIRAQRLARFWLKCSRLPSTIK